MMATVMRPFAGTSRGDEQQGFVMAAQRIHSDGCSGCSSRQHSTVVKFFNLYYASMHFTCMIIFLIWLFVRHREHYPRVRTTMAMATAFALLIQLIPVAPPRMIAKADLIDTPLYFDQSVYAR